MSFIPFNPRKVPKVELRPKQCIDSVLKPLTDNINIKINGSLTCKDIFHTAVCMAVDNSLIHSISKHYQEVVCETSIRHHFKKLDIDDLIRLNEKILLQGPINSLKPEKKYFTIIKPGPSTIDEDRFRFARFILFVEEWLRRKLRVQLVVECLRQIDSGKNKKKEKIREVLVRQEATI